MLTCPICGRDLAREGPRFCCDNGHSFDVARQGYVNLLQTPYPGDTRAMLRARRAFLDAGHYRPLSTAITTAALDHLVSEDGDAPGAVLDVGAGEGAYLGAVAAAADARGVSARFFGLDVSKDAIALAAKTHRTIQFVVANVRDRLPFGDASLGVLLSIFAPRNAFEFARVLAPAGLLLVAMPTPQHLREARAAFGLLDVEPEKARRLHAQLAGPFVFIGTERIEYSLTLEGLDLERLIVMSPNAYHVTAETLARAQQTDRFTVTVSVLLQRYQRCLSV